MIKKNLYIIGTGDHARVVFSEVRKLKNFIFKGFISKISANSKIFNLDKNSKYKDLNRIKNIKSLVLKNFFVVAVGDNKTRKKIVKEYEKKFINVKWATIISKNANIEKNVKIGEGSMIISGSTINIGSRIGKHTIINTNCSIDHDNKIYDYVNSSPGITSAGNVTIKDQVFVGLGSSIKQNVIIDKNVTVGAHSYVNKDCRANFTYYGVPIKKR